MSENPNVMTFVRGTGGNTLVNFQEIIDDRETFSYLTDEDRASLQDFVDKKKQTGHACISETGRVYAFRPETVRLDLIASESGKSIHRFDEFSKHKIETYMTWMANYPNSYSADNDYVLNERLARAMAEKNVNNLAETFKFLKNERISDEFHAEWLKKQQ